MFTFVQAIRWPTNDIPAAKLENDGKMAKFSLELQSLRVNFSQTVAPVKGLDRKGKKEKKLLNTVLKIIK